MKKFTTLGLIAALIAFSANAGSFKNLSEGGSDSISNLVEGTAAGISTSAEGILQSGAASLTSAGSEKISEGLAKTVAGPFIVSATVVNFASETVEVTLTFAGEASVATSQAVAISGEAVSNAAKWSADTASDAIEFSVEVTSDVAKALVEAGAVSVAFLWNTVGDASVTASQNVSYALEYSANGDIGKGSSELLMILPDSSEALLNADEFYAGDRK